MAQRRRRARPARSASTTRRRSGWRATVDSFGGFAVIGTVAVAVVIVAAIVFRTQLGFDQSDAPLLGDVVAGSGAQHVPDGSLPNDAASAPAGGSHYSLPQHVDAYDQPIADGNAVHALEHGVVWISYHPDLISAGDVEALRGLQSDFSRDAILSPRPANADAIAIVSWGRRLTLERVDLEVLRAFIETNRNRSPEPGTR